MTRATVSDHAITRYQQRVVAVTYEAARDAIAAVVQRSVDAAVDRAVSAGEWRVRVDGVIFVLAGPHVVTVLTEPPRSAERVRPICRRPITFDHGAQV